MKHDAGREAEIILRLTEKVRLQVIALESPVKRPLRPGESASVGGNQMMCPIQKH